jgi:hypothetical protein
MAMREPMTERRLREAREIAWSPAYRPPPDFPEHVYRHDLLRDAVSEIERLRGTAGEWRSTLAALHHILAEHRIVMRIEPGRPGPPKLVTDLMQWVATAVECETHLQREHAERAEAEAKQLRSQLGDPEIQWGHQVHADDGHRGDEVPQADENAARIAVAHLNMYKLPAGSRAVLIQREVRVHEGLWRVVPVCECPHTCQPDGRLVRDGVLALGCPVHDPDAGGCGDA